MKISLLIICLFFVVTVSNAQSTSVDLMQGNFKQMSLFKGNNTGYQGFQTYGAQNVRGSQFFYPGFQDGSVTTINNEQLTGIYQFLFDKVRQELFITSKTDKSSSPEVLVAEKQQVKSFSITTDREHTFVAARIYDPSNTTDFYELLNKNDSPYTLLKAVKTTFVKMDYRDLEKVKHGDIYDEFVDKTSYYVSYKSGKPREISFRKKNLANAFQADKKILIENYIDNHPNDDVDEGYLLNLVYSANNY